MGKRLASRETIRQKVNQAGENLARKQEMEAALASGCRCPGVLFLEVDGMYVSFRAVDENDARRLLLELAEGLEQEKGLRLRRELKRLLAALSSLEQSMRDYRSAPFSMLQDEAGRFSGVRFVQDYRNSKPRRGREETCFASKDVIVASGGDWQRRRFLPGPEPAPE